MKKIVIMFVALTLAMGSQAQIGNLIGGAVRKSVEKKIDQTVEKKADALLGNKNLLKQNKDTQREQKLESVKTNDDDRIPTPEEVMGMVPQLPSQQHLAEYACEQHRANPRTLRMLTSPVTTFLTQMAVASASGYVVMMGGSNTGSLYSFDEQLLKEFGISEEQYNAMSEEEQQQLATKYATELQDRYLRTAERLAADPLYNRMMDQYTAIDNEIEQRYHAADSLCDVMWQKRFAGKENPSEADMCEYYRMAVPVQYRAVVDAMQVRKNRQLAVAKQIDGYVQQLAQNHPKEVYAGFYNQGGICATSYVGDAARLTTIGSK